MLSAFSPDTPTLCELLKARHVSHTHNVGHSWYSPDLYPSPLWAVFPQAAILLRAASLVPRIQNTLAKSQNTDGISEAVPVLRPTGWPTGLLSRLTGLWTVTEATGGQRKLTETPDISTPFTEQLKPRPGCSEAKKKEVSRRKRIGKSQCHVHSWK